MERPTRRLALAGLFASLTVAATEARAGLFDFLKPKPETATGNGITQILVDKSKRKMYLLNGKKAVRTYKIDLGFSPKGHKTKQGDGKTPEGLYRIDRKNPQSQFHLSLGVSYPNAADRAQAARRGVSPGGDIFIHGMGHHDEKRGTDWTWGCIAVSDAEIEEIFSMVDVGTPIYIKA